MLVLVHVLSAYSERTSSLHPQLILVSSAQPNEKLVNHCFLVLGYTVTKRDQNLNCKALRRLVVHGISQVHCHINVETIICILSYDFKN